MTCPTVVGGVDTHKHTHHATVIGADGVLIASREFPATAAGHSQLAAWFTTHGEVRAVGVEGTGSFGAPVARSLQAQGIAVVEVNRPNREARRRSGKSDVLDAEQAARAVLARTATAAVLVEESTCWICGGSDFVALARHRWSRSVDHVEPLAAGGRLLERSNLRLAHYGCNSSRGASAARSRGLSGRSEMW